jgi:transposase
MPEARAAAPSPTLSVAEKAALQAALDQAGLGALAQRLEQMQQAIVQHDQEIHWRDAKIDKLSFELALLRRLRFGRTSEHLDASQRALFEESVEADIAAVEAELEGLRPAPAPKPEGQAPKRQALPAHLPRTEFHHEPADTTCPSAGCGQPMKRVGEDVSEKLDYNPGQFSVHRHIRGKWACRHCQRLGIERLVQEPVAADIIDKGIPTAGLLAHVLVAKYADHLPLYRQEAIFERAGVALGRSTLAAWVGQCGVRLAPVVEALKAELLACAVLHADETPVQTLAPGTGKTHRSYLWAYLSGPHEALRAVVYDFADSRAGEHARQFLGPWRGSLVCDDYAGYKALFAQGVTEAGCMAHARRKFDELHQANKSTLALQALRYIGRLYDIEREARHLDAAQRLHQRQTLAAPIAQALHAWLQAQRSTLPDSGATAKAIDYSLKRWAALTRYLSDPDLPIDNNRDEQQMRPIATGRKNWLFAGTHQAGQRAAAIMSLVQSAKLNGHDPYAYLKDILTRLPTHPASRIGELLPHRWVPPSG